MRWTLRALSEQRKGARHDYLADRRAGLRVPVPGRVGFRSWSIRQMTTHHFAAASRLIVLRARRRAFYTRALPYVAAVAVYALYALLGGFDKP